MNFQKLPPVETSKQYLDIAFRRAREKGTSEDFKGNWLQIIRKKECLKLDVVRDSLVKRLDKVINKYPDLDALSEFYIKLIKLTLEYGEFKKS